VHSGAPIIGYWLCAQRRRALAKFWFHITFQKYGYGRTETRRFAQ
jgi:hypothetical protein